jgi:hypothetical protein
MLDAVSVVVAALGGLEVFLGLAVSALWFFAAALSAAAASGANSVAGGSV